MAKRTPGFEKPDTLIPKAIRNLGPEIAQKYYENWAVWHWRDIVGKDFARHVRAVKVERNVLYLSCFESVWQNEARLLMPQLVSKVNTFAGQKLIREIRFVSFRELRDLRAEIETEREKQAAAERKKLSERKKTVLTDAEIRQARDDGRRFAFDADLERAVMKMSLERKKMKRWQEQENWQPCQRCGTMTEPGTVFCPACRCKRNAELRSRVRAVLRDIPWARCHEVRTYVPECTPALLNEERALLVQQLAAKVDVNDTTSLDAKTLVMLYRCLPPDELTEENVRRALYRLRFDLHRPRDYRTPKRYDVIGRHRKKGN